MTPLQSFGLGAVLFSVGWAVVFWKYSATVELNPLDILFILTTFISLIFNVVQNQRDKGRFDPIRDALIGLFNDLKARQLRGYGKRNLLLNALTSGTGQVQAREFLDFIEETQMGFEQVREHVVALIKSVDPNMPEDKIFKAALFGLDNQEKQMREEVAENYRKNAREADRRPPNPPPTTAPPTPTESGPTK